MTANKPELRQMISLCGRKPRQSSSPVPDEWKPIIAELNEYVMAGSGRQKELPLCMGFDRTAAGTVPCRSNALPRKDYCARHKR